VKSIKKDLFVEQRGEVRGEHCIEMVKNGFEKFVFAFKMAIHSRFADADGRCHIPDGKFLDSLSSGEFDGCLNEFQLPLGVHVPLLIVS
jgi:hypothetical protein